MTRTALIDTHVHFWDLRDPDDGLAWVWLEKGFDHPVLGNIDNMKSDRYDIEGVWAEARFADVEAFVHVQAALGSSDPVQETRWLERMRSTAPVPFAIVAHADLGTAAAGAQLDAHAEASPAFAGVRDFAVEPMLASGETVAAFEESFAALAARGLVLDTDCEWPNMATLRGLAARHPDLPIVLEHIGFPRTRDDEYFGNWSTALRELALAPNVTCKISGLGMTDPRFTADSLRRWVETCVEAFGPERCVLGSNWPLDRLYSSYDAIMTLYREFIGTLSADEQTAVLAGNAKRLYRL